MSLYGRVHPSYYTFLLERLGQVRLGQVRFKSASIGGDIYQCWGVFMSLYGCVQSLYHTFLLKRLGQVRLGQVRLGRLGQVRSKSVLESFSIHITLPMCYTINILPKQVIILANFEVLYTSTCFDIRMWADFLFRASENTSAILGVKFHKVRDMATQGCGPRAERQPSPST